MLGALFAFVDWALQNTDTFTHRDIMKRYSIDQVIAKRWATELVLAGLAVELPRLNANEQRKYHRIKSIVKVPYKIPN